MTKRAATPKPLVTGPLILTVLDGWGIDKPNRGNAVALAKTATMDGLTRKYPHTTLWAHGKHVGLPHRQVGNSEAGHMNIGAGRLVEQDSVRISKSIEDGTFFKNPAFLGAIRHVHKWGSKLHLIGLLSNGQSPHSDPEHLFALIALLRRHAVENVYLHLFTDGRDSPKYASLKLVADLERTVLKGAYPIASVMGRFYAMDRKKAWDRTAAAYRALTDGTGRKAESAQAAIAESYNRGESDEYIEPYVIHDERTRNSRIESKDSVVFFNLRSDRSRQLTKVFVQQKFNEKNTGAFTRRHKLEHLYFAAMTDFGPDLDDILTAYPSFDLTDTLPMALIDKKQLYIAEEEKFAHVTYFFNGGYAGSVANEKQVKVPSPDVKSYDETPAMSSEALVRTVLKGLSSRSKNSRYDFTVLNFAAPDMIGHTGNLRAAIECCEKVDRLLAKLVRGFFEVDGTLIITADHGNIERMINLETGEIYTEHTTNPVPFLIVGRRFRKQALPLRHGGTLGHVAPTILSLLGLPIPALMHCDPLHINTRNER